MSMFGRTCAQSFSICLVLVHHHLITWKNSNREPQSFKSHQSFLFIFLQLYRRNAAPHSQNSGIYCFKLYINSINEVWHSKMSSEGKGVMNLAEGTRRLCACKDKQPFNSGADLFLREDTEEFCQEMIPKGISRLACCYDYGSCQTKGQLVDGNCDVAAIGERELTGGSLIPLQPLWPDASISSGSNEATDICCAPSGHTAHQASGSKYDLCCATSQTCSLTNLLFATFTLYLTVSSISQ